MQQRSHHRTSSLPLPSSPNALTILLQASVYKMYTVPKLYLKLEYCIACAIHAHIVRCRPAVNRRIRTPPIRQRRDEPLPDTGKPMRGLKRSARRPKIVSTAEEQEK